MLSRGDGGLWEQCAENSCCWSLPDRGRWAPRNRRLISILLDEVKSSDERVVLLDARDNFVIDGGHTIPEFLIRLGHEDLALRSIELGATITERVFLLAMQSVGTTEHGTKLAEHVLRHFIDHNHRLDQHIHWKSKVALLALPKNVKDELGSLIGFEGGSKAVSDQLFDYLTKEERWIVAGPGSGETFHVFGDFSRQYRWRDGALIDLRGEFLKLSENRRSFRLLQELFKEVKVSSST